jgi:hypothetical protein
MEDEVRNGSRNSVVLPLHRPPRGVPFATAPIFCMHHREQAQPHILARKVRVTVFASFYGRRCRYACLATSAERRGRLVVRAESGQAQMATKVATTVALTTS